MLLRRVITTVARTPPLSWCFGCAMTTSIIESFAVGVAEKNQSSMEQFGVCPDIIAISMSETTALGRGHVKDGGPCVPFMSEVIEEAELRSRLSWKALAENTLKLATCRPHLLCRVRELEEEGKEALEARMAADRARFGKRKIRTVPFLGGCRPPDLRWGQTQQRCAYALVSGGGGSEGQQPSSNGTVHICV